MNDKEKEIKELKDKLSQLEESTNSDNKKEEGKKPGFLGKIISIVFVMAVIGWFLQDDSDSSSLTEDVMSEQQKTTPLEDPNDKYRAQIIASLAKQDFQAYWGQDNSLWIENPGFPKSELERFGYQLCDVTKAFGLKQSYIITFWQSLRNGPNGQILKVNCF